MRRGHLKVRDKSTLVRANVDIGKATLITDEYAGYFGTKTFMDHKTINHHLRYIDGDTHTTALSRSGRCSSAASLANTKRSASSACRATLTSSRTATTIATPPTFSMSPSRGQ
jgi:hypothetical protein